jgi:hypothetical protein
MVTKTKTSTQRPTTFVKGGAGHMVKPQAAGPARAAHTGKVPTAAPGPKSARGGGHAAVPDRVLSAKPGRTGVR